MKWNCGDFEIHVRYELLIIERILRLKYHAMFELELVNVTISRHKVRKLEISFTKYLQKVSPNLIIAFTIEIHLKKSRTNCKKRLAIWIQIL